MFLCFFTACPPRIKVVSTRFATNPKFKDVYADSASNADHISSLFHWTGFVVTRSEPKE